MNAGHLHWDVLLHFVVVNLSVFLLIWIKSVLVTPGRQDMHSHDQVQFMGLSAHNLSPSSSLQISWAQVKEIWALYMCLKRWSFASRLVPAFLSSSPNLNLENLQVRFLQVQGWAGIWNLSKIRRSQSSTILGTSKCSLFYFILLLPSETCKLELELCVAGPLVRFACSRKHHVKIHLVLLCLNRG